MGVPHRPQGGVEPGRSSFPYPHPSKELAEFACVVTVCIDCADGPAILGKPIYVPFDKCGRPKSLDPAKAALARRMQASGEPVTTIASALGVSRATVYRTLSDENAS